MAYSGDKADLLTDDDDYKDVFTSKNSLVTEPFEENNELYIEFIYPVTGYDNTIIGAVSGYKNIDYLMDLVDKYKVGDTGYLYVINHYIYP